MTTRAKKEAERLVLSFLYVPDEAMPIDSNKAWVDKDIAKRCALIAVGEIKKAIEVTTGHCELRALDRQEVHSDLLFWGEVEQEIENL